MNAGASHSLLVPICQSTPMGVIRKIKRAVRGEVKPKTVVLEVFRRTRAARQTRQERASLDRINSEMPKLSLAKKEGLLAHFRDRVEPHFFPGFSNAALARLQK